MGSEVILWLIFQTGRGADEQKVLPNNETLSRVVLAQCTAGVRLRWQSVRERLQDEVEKLRVSKNNSYHWH